MEDIFDIPCDERHCNKPSEMHYFLKVKGFMQKMEVNLCEVSSEKLGQEELNLKNGGKVAKFEDYIRS